LSAVAEGPAVVRVVSLVPSVTETLLAIGADVIACTRFCEQPQLPHVGGTKNPDVAAIIGLAPDLVVMDRQENRRQDADALAEAGLRLHVTDVCSVDDASAVVGALAELVGRPSPDLPISPSASPSSGAPRVFVPIWYRPWMSIGPGTYGASLLRAIGCRLVTGSAPVAYPEVELDDIARLDPDVVIVPSEPYDFRESQIGELRLALPRAEVRRVDGQDLFWWGIRTPMALDRLRAVVRRPPP
jgi:ABC-type Fe3+-hydroxamate transport system substrate-binding protein